MNLQIIQGLVCLLIVLWGVAMLAVGVMGGNPTWMVLDLAVLIVGLPFARNALRSNGERRPYHLGKPFRGWRTFALRGWV